MADRPSSDPRSDGSGLRLDRVRVGYRSGRRWPTAGSEHVVVTDVDAVARRGEVTAVLGPNGAGKSTLLRSLMGLQPLLGGTVRLDGTDLAGLSTRDRARRAAVVLTDRVDVGLLTGREVAELGRHPHRGFARRLTADEDALVTRSLSDLHALDLADAPVNELSDGQRQRVLLARALVQQPDLLVLDEPSAFLDVGARVDLMALLARVAAESGICVVVSTHEVELALRTTQRLWVIDGAHLVSGTPAGLVADGSIGAVFETDATRFDPASGTFRLRSAPPSGALGPAPRPADTAGT